MKTKISITCTVLSFMVLFPTLLLYAQVNPPSLTQATSAPPEVLTPGDNITVNFKEVDIRTVLHYLSEISGVDIIPTAEVTGSVTMRLRDKPWEVVLDVVTRTFDYAYSRDGDIIRVMPKDKLHTESPVTEVIPLNYIIQDAGATEGKEEEDEGKDEGRDKDQNISQLLKAIGGIIVKASGEKATFLPSANAIVVTAIPSRISSIKKMISKLDVKTPQIMLEAKIIEVTLDKNDQFGIDWNTVVAATGARRPITFPFTNSGLLSFLPIDVQRKYFPVTTSSVESTTIGSGGATTTSSTVTSQGAAFPFASSSSGINTTDAPTTSSIFSYGTLDFSQFSAVLRMLKERDDTNILSSPRVTTLNNQMAVIKVINKVYLQKQQKATDTATTVTVEFEPENDAKEVGVKLEVTPHVNDKGEIIVNLNPKVDSNLTFTELQVSGAQNTVAMSFNSREADTRVMVKDGETIFIGGLITKTTTKQEHKFPILGDVLGWIPVAGNVFKYEQDNVDKTEVVFFVTVYLLKDGMQSIQASQTIPEYIKFYGQGKTEDEKKEPKLLLDVKKNKDTIEDNTGGSIQVE